MATTPLNWDNTAVNASVNALTQTAYKRIKSVGGAWSTSGFSPSNPLLKTANFTEATVTPNIIYEFKVEANCTLGGPTPNSNGIKEQIVFECLPITIDKTSVTVIVNTNLLNIDFTKVKYTLRKASDDSLVSTATISKTSDAAPHTFTGLTGNTAYYVEVEYYTDIEGVEVLSSDSAYLNALCGGNVEGYTVTTNIGCEEWKNETVGIIHNVDYTDCRGVVKTNQDVAVGDSICAQTGTVTGGDSGDLSLIGSCSLGELKITSTNFGGTITNITGIPGYTFNVGNPVTIGETQLSSHGDMSLETVSITVGGTPTSGNITISVNGVVVGCVNVPGSTPGVYNVNNVSGIRTLDMHIAFNTGICPP